MVTYSVSGVSGVIERMLNAKIRVSPERLRVLFIVYCQSDASGENLGRIHDYLSRNIRLQESRCQVVDECSLKMLELLELNPAPEVMANVLANLSVPAKG